VRAHHLFFTAIVAGCTERSTEFYAVGNGHQFGPFIDMASCEKFRSEAGGRTAACWRGR
jgi:hypothetical protein